MALNEIIGWIVGGGLVTVLSGATILWNNITNTKAMRVELSELRAEVKILREENMQLKAEVTLLREENIQLRNKIAELTTMTKRFCEHI